MKRIEAFIIVICLMLSMSACAQESFQVKEIKEIREGGMIETLWGMAIDTILNAAYPEVSGFSDKEFEKKVNQLIKDNAYSLMEEPFRCNVGYEILSKPTKGGGTLSILQTWEDYDEKNNFFKRVIVVNVDVENQKILGDEPADWGIDIGNSWHMSLAIQGHCNPDLMWIGRPYCMEFDEFKIGIKNDSIALVFWSSADGYDEGLFEAVTYIPKTEMMDAVTQKEFEDFLSFFCKDRQSQLSRIKFPVGERRIYIDGPCPKNDPNYVDDDMSGCYKIETFTSKNWKTLNRKNLSPFYDEGEGVYCTWNKTNTIAQFIVGAGFDPLCLCTFEKINNEWYLTKYMLY